MWPDVSDQLASLGGSIRFQPRGITGIWLRRPWTLYSIQLLSVLEKSTIGTRGWEVLGEGVCVESCRVFLWWINGKGISRHGRFESGYRYVVAYNRSSLPPYRTRVSLLELKMFPTASARCRGLWRRKGKGYRWEICVCLLLVRLKNRKIECQRKWCGILYRNK